MRKPDFSDMSDEPTPAVTPQWRKARKPTLLPSTSADDALAENVTRAVDHMRANEACVLARAHIEGVHQMRVASRRLRSSLALYRPFIPDDQRRYLNTELKWLINEMGPARDWDVFVDETLGPVAAQFPDDSALKDLCKAADKRRDQAYSRAQTAIKTQRYVGLTMLLGAWSKGHRWNDGTVTTENRRQLARPATELAQTLLDELWTTVKEAGDGFETLTGEARHDLRLHIKKLRYGMEFFESLYRKSQAGPYLLVVKSLQDSLGVDNDIFVAQGLLKPLVKSVPGRKPAAFRHAIGLIIGWHSHIGSERAQKSLSSWDRFVNGKPFWRNPEAHTVLRADQNETIDPFGTLSNA
jgi:CHAD domain-containing protein